MLPPQAALLMYPALLTRSMSMLHAYTKVKIAAETLHGLTKLSRLMHNDRHGHASNFNRQGHAPMGFIARHQLKKKAGRFAKGIVRCSGCRKTSSLSELDPLSITRCPKCDRPTFVPLRIGDFWLCEPLGGGGEGSAYKSIHQDSHKICALKVLRRQDREIPSAIAALGREAVLLKEIGEHPHIVGLISAGCENSEHYTALEYVEGERLDTRIARVEHIPEQDVARMALALLSAEQHIVDRGYLYRDLKPENIMIEKTGRPVLLDFGFCVSLEEARTQTNDEFIRGSPHYLPPERLWRSGEGLASEIYSLGMVMYHALTGRTFFKTTEEAAQLAVRHATSLRLTIQPSSMQHCSPAMMELVDLMIKRDPGERPQSFDVVERALRKCLPGKC